MRIRPVEKGPLPPEFSPLYAPFDQSRRIVRGTSNLVNVSWIAREIQTALNTGIGCDRIYYTIAPAEELAKLLDTGEAKNYRPYAKRLSAYDCGQPLIVTFKDKIPPASINEKDCEILDGKARVVRALDENMSLRVILISKELAIEWGMPTQLRMLGVQKTSIELPLNTAEGPAGQRNHRQRSGFNTLPEGSTSGNAVISRRVKTARAASGDAVTNPFAYSMILSSDRRVRKYFHDKLRLRKLTPRGLIDAFPEVKKSGRPPRQYQETCHLILLAKLLKAGCTLKDLRGPMRDLLRLPVNAKLLEDDDENYEVDEKLERWAKRASTALRKAPSAWRAPLSERLLLYSATLPPFAENDERDKETLLTAHRTDLLKWTFYSLFRTKHWRIGRNLIERFNIKDDKFPNCDEDDPSVETSTVPRIHHEVAGSVEFQGITDLTVEQLLTISMHARTNLFLIQHDLHWAVPLGHWAMAIADLDAGRETHVTTWMAELYEEQRRRQLRDDRVNPFTGPSTMIVHWLHWVCGDVERFAEQMADICEFVIEGFPVRSGRLVKFDIDQEGGRKMDSDFLTHEEDEALQATQFA